MHFFLDPDFAPNTALLTASESRHAHTVLRLSPEEHILVGDGRGALYTCRILGEQKGALLLEILEQRLEAEALPKLSIAMGITKQAARFEWFAEKACELGISGIIPMLSTHCERKHFNDKRLQKILLSASKQSRRAHLPTLHPLMDMDEVLRLEADAKYIAHCHSERNRIPLARVLLQSKAAHQLILIGPEGDFSVKELEKARAAACTEISLGDLRLRTETAGVYAAALASAFAKMDETKQS